MESTQSLGVFQVECRLLNEWEMWPLTKTTGEVPMDMVMVSALNSLTPSLRPLEPLRISKAHAHEGPFKPPADQSTLNVALFK